MKPQDSLTLALVQTALYWEDISANLAVLEEQLAGLESHPDVIILPEMFPTGFSMEPERIAEPLNLTVTRWMSRMALSSGALVIGSFAAREGRNFYNRLIAMQPDGTYRYYDKRHLFRMAGEDKAYTAGTQRIIVSWKGWQICPLICYDLRFPVWCRNLLSDPYDLLVFVANWPESRAHAWDTLLQARAIENISYVAGVNRTGADGHGIAHNGGSALLDFLGRPVTRLTNETQMAVSTISKQELTEYRRRFPALRDSDTFEIQGIS